MADEHAPDLNDKNALTTAQTAGESPSPQKKVLRIALSILWLVLAISLAQTSWQIFHQREVSLVQFALATFYAFAALVLAFSGCIGLRKAFQSGKSNQT